MSGVDWFQVHSRQLPAGEYHHKPGVRGHPDLPPGHQLILRLDLADSGHLLDLTGSAGLTALQARGQGGESQLVLEPSAAALSCAALAGPARAGLPWDALDHQADTVVLQVQADRGNARVELEIRSVAARLREGRLLLLGHKDQGAKRFERLAASLFSQAEVTRKDKGFRLLECRHGLPAEAPEVGVAFQAAGLQLTAVKGTFAAGKEDPGTRQLIAAMGDTSWLAGRQVLDLGCGYGLLSLLAAAAGAGVLAVDDDLAAVRSTEANAGALGLQGRLKVLHSDLDSQLPPGTRFDTVLMNPPFHVGRGVRLDLSRAFLDTARRRLLPGGELWLVANRDLPYGRLLADWKQHSVLRDEAGFRVYRAVR